MINAHFEWILTQHENVCQSILIFCLLIDKINFLSIFSSIIYYYLYVFFFSVHSLEKFG